MRLPALLCVLVCVARDSACLSPELERPHPADGEVSSATTASAVSPAGYSDPPDEGQLAAGGPVAHAPVADSNAAPEDRLAVVTSRLAALETSQVAMTAAVADLRARLEEALARQAPAWTREEAVGRLSGLKAALERVSSRLKTVEAAVSRCQASKLGERCRRDSDCLATRSVCDADQGVCVCDGVSWSPDGRECQPGSRTFLLVSLRTSLMTVSLHSPAQRNTTLPLDGLRSADAVDYDPVEDAVYWSDVMAHTISRARPDGSARRVIVNDSSPEGIAVDWIARNLVWVEAVPAAIMASRLDGSARLTLLEEGLDQPRALALDPAAGHMYWSDWSARPRIERAALDGSRRQLLVTEGLVWPNSLALDLPAGRLYWHDAKTARIESVALDGEDRTVLLAGGEPSYSFGLALLGDFVYFTDWRRGRLERVHKETGGSHAVLATGRMMGLKAASRTPAAELGSNPCAVDNGGCSHLCFHTPTGPVCKQPSPTD